ncbi:MAG: DUF6644 family protein [Pseudomonadales bacterium]
MEARVYAVLVWLEDSALGAVLRDAGVWTYAWLNLLHILGIAALFGAVLVLDLRLIGCWRRIPFAQIARPTVPLAGMGLAAAVLSGGMMITVNATGYDGNPFLYVKLPLVVLGILNVAVIARLPAWRRALAGQADASADRWMLRTAGASSLAIWLGVIVCGRMIGYW